MKNFVVAFLFTLVFAAVMAAQTTSKVHFASVYSDLSADCRNYSGRDGSDGYSLCRGPGGYRVRNYYSAAAALYNAELIADKDGPGFPITMVALDFDDRKTKIEWRTAGGKPFAVIMRVPTYAEPRESSEYFGPVNGETLVIKGLKGVDLDTSVDAKLPGANKTARDIADAAYLKAKK